MNKVVSWFSAGVSSAVATKIAIDSYGCNDVIYVEIDDAHPDNKRFIAECEQWFGVKIQRLKSKYGSVDNVMVSQRYINSPTGAPCSRLLKMRVRQEWEFNQDCPLTYVWGFDWNERERATRRAESLCDYGHIFPLIDREITKDVVHGMIENAGIKRPIMYDLGFPNNNCIGCVKGGMGYWNLIRKEFPEVFELRAKRERELGATCIKGVYLDELEEGRGINNPIVPDCGLFCAID